MRIEAHSEDVRTCFTDTDSLSTHLFFCQPSTNLSLDIFFIFRCSFYGTIVSELMLRTKGTFSCSMFTLRLTLSLTPVHNRTISTAVEQRWESTGFTMSVGRLAEPPKHSFLLPSEVSQSHTFMCNACKHMHQTQWHSRETRGGERGGVETKNGLLSKWVRAHRHHRTTTVFKEINIQR